MNSPYPNKVKYKTKYINLRDYQNSAIVADII